MALDHRITTREQDLSQFATIQTNETGAMVLVTPKGGVIPKRNNNGKDILRRYGNPSAEFWGTFEALSFVTAAPLYIACAIGAGARYAGVDVNTTNVTGFGYGRSGPDSIDFSAIPVQATPYALGVGTGVQTVFPGTIPLTVVQEASLVVYVGGVARATVDAAGVITGSGISGTINYNSGAISVTFTVAPGNGVAVTVGYRHLVDKTQTIAFCLLKASPYNDSYERYDIKVAQVTGVPGVQYQATLYQVAGAVTKTIDTYQFSLLPEKDAFGRSTYIFDIFDGSDYIIPVVNEDYAGTVALVSTPAIAEITDITFVAEVGGGVSSNYHNKYFLFENAAGTSKYFLWFNVDAGGTVPVVAGRTAIQVAVTAGDSAGTIAAAVQAAIDPLADITATVLSAVVTVTQGIAGACVDIANSGVPAPITIAVTTQGANAVITTTAVTMDGGSRGAAPQPSDFVAAWEQFQAYNRYKAKILMDVYGNSANTISTMQTAALPYTHAITCVPMGLAVSAAVAHRTGLSINSDKISIYFNHHRIQDPYNGTGASAWVSGVGKIGAKYAAMEDVYDSLSPAGIDENGHGGSLSGFTPIETEYELFPQDKRDLDAAQINSVVFDDEEGLIVIGDFTMQTTQSDTSFIGTRRLYNLLLEAISKQVLRRQVFKNNDTFHRLKAFSLTDSLLTPVKAGEFLFDYRIQCDLDNNDAPIRNARKFVLTVFVQAQTNSQEVELNFVRLPQGDVLASLGG